MNQLITGTQTRATNRQPMPVPPEQLVEKAIRKASRYELTGASGIMLGKREYMNQTRLTVALLKDLRHSYVTFPQSVRKALEEFLRG
jgi:hypothetical protein